MEACEKYWKIKNWKKKKKNNPKQHKQIRCWWWEKKMKWGVSWYVRKPRLRAAQRCSESWVTHAHAWTRLLPSISPWQLLCPLDTHAGTCTSTPRNLQAATAGFASQQRAYWSIRLTDQSPPSNIHLRAGWQKRLNTISCTIPYLPLTACAPQPRFVTTFFTHGHVFPLRLKQKAGHKATGGKEYVF